MNIEVICNLQSMDGMCPITDEFVSYGDGPKLILRSDNNGLCPVSLLAAERYAPLEATAYKAMEAEYAKLRGQQDEGVSAEELRALMDGKVTPYDLYEQPDVYVAHADSLLWGDPCALCGENTYEDLYTFAFHLGGGQGQPICEGCGKKFGAESVKGLYDRLTHESDLAGGVHKLPRTYYPTEDPIA